jgi:RNA polymerase-binding transcription factor DksA
MTDDAIDQDSARAQLEQMRADLRRSIGELDALQRADGPITMSGDAGADTTAESANLELRSELEAQLADVEAALGRLDAGTYGIDEDTGEPIDPARLRAVPTARTNI